MISAGKRDSLVENTRLIESGFQRLARGDEIPGTVPQVRHGESVPWRTEMTQRLWCFTQTANYDAVALAGIKFSGSSNLSRFRSS
jgi:hypothetical protein